MISRRNMLATLPALLVPALARGQRQHLVAGVWSGAVTDAGAVIKVLSRAPDVPVTLRVTSPTGQADEQILLTDRDGVAGFALSGLRARTRYRYIVSTPGEAPIDGGFRTFADGPSSFRVIFGSCARTGSASPVFTAMRQLDPDLFVHMGDLHYENIAVNEVGRFRRAYHEVLSSPTQSALFRSAPMAYTWDDHDYGPNDSDRRSPSRPAALEAYRRFVPHYPRPEHAGVFQAFTVGRVRFVMTDARSARSPRSAPRAERTMLGAAQRAWLVEELEAAGSAPLVVWVNTVPWITKRDESTREGWAPYDDERRHLADTIGRLGLTDRLVMLSGDAHMLAIDDGTNSQYSTLPNAPRRGFVVAHAAPMDQRTTTKGGPYSHPEIASNGQYGVMDVTDEGGRVTVRLQGMRGAKPLPRMRLEWTL